MIRLMKTSQEPRTKSQDKRTKTKEQRQTSQEPRQKNKDKRTKNQYMREDNRLITRGYKEKETNVSFVSFSLCCELICLLSFFSFVFYLLSFIFCFLSWIFVLLSLFFVLESFLLITIYPGSFKAFVRFTKSFHKLNCFITIGEGLDGNAIRPGG